MVMNVKAGETGKLYGKVTNKEVAQLLEKNLGQEIDKRLLKVSGDINATGSYKVQVKLTPEVQAEVQLEVLAEGQSYKLKEDEEKANAEAADAESNEEEKTEE